MLPLAALGIGLSPVAARLVGRRGVREPLLIGCAGLFVGLLAVLTLDVDTPVAGIVAVGVVFGLPSAFNNLALQATAYGAVPAGQTGVAAGLFQTCRYVGAILSTALLGLAFEHAVTSAGLHRIAGMMLVVAVLLGVGAAGAGHIGSHRGRGTRLRRADTVEPRHLAREGRDDGTGTGRPHRDRGGVAAARRIGDAAGRRLHLR
jgi:MFS family permease